MTANVDLEDLNEFYRAAKVGPESHIALLRDDGTLLVRTPGVPNIVGRKFPVLAAAPAGADARVVNPIDGRENFIAVAPVRNAPLRLAVTRDAEVALRPWRDETVRVAFRTLIVVLLGALLLALLLRQIKRVASSQQALRESEERYALAMEGANEGHWDWDVRRRPPVLVAPNENAGWPECRQSRVASGSEWMSAHRRCTTRTGRGSRRRCKITWRVACRASSASTECVTPTASGIGCWRAADARSMRPASRRDSWARPSISPTRNRRSSKRNVWKRSCGSRRKWRRSARLAGGIAHDFNNVLGAILGYGELAMQHSGGNSALRRYLDNVMHAAERAKLLVERILGFSRSGLGDQVLVNVQSVVSETLELLAGSLPTGIRLETQTRGGRCCGDRRPDLSASGHDESVYQRRAGHGARGRARRHRGTRAIDSSPDPCTRLARPGRICATRGHGHRRREFLRRRWSESSILFLPPRTSARARGWGSRWCTVSSPIWGARSM